MKKLVFSISMLAAAALFLTSCGGGSEEVAPAADTTVVAEAPAAPAMDLTAGKAVYDAKCKVCHQENGQGTPSVFPPLDAADYMLADVSRAIKQIKNGSTEPITVNGVKFTNGAMAPAVKGLTDQEILDVANYIFNSWSNKHGEIKMEDVTAALSAK